ncbi:nucleoside monophosphate kinase [Candidatus Microgenomates bacterium]|nr:nucleoside monophosphate kinase [Candidatus Microgenomates bacterium]
MASFNLSDPKQRRDYFEHKVGDEIARLKEYFKSGNTFVAYLLGKKNSGKGTYSKLFMEIFGEKHVAHISVGDIVRDVHTNFENSARKKELVSFLQKNYRGFISIDEALERLMSRDTKTLLPTEFVLALVKYEISKMPKRALFIDGFPRGIDQVSYSLYFRELIGYRDDPDFFVIINVPEAVIDERIKSRVVCPICHTPRGLKLLRTKEVGYDRKSGEFFLKCDTPECRGARLVAKEGDELGIEPIRTRLEVDAKMMQTATGLHGIPKIALNNSVPVKESSQVYASYEITPEFVYSWDGKHQRVVVEERPWVVKDDHGVPSYSLMPPAVVVSLIQQMVEVLGI